MLNSDGERDSVRYSEEVRKTGLASSCTHHSYPILINPTDTGHYARCLGCLTTGPVRPSSEAAREALLTR
jgi:hypothetical protein